MNNKTQQIVALGFAGLLAVMVPAFAADATAKTTTKKSTNPVTGTTTKTTKTTVKPSVDHADRKFLTDAAAGGMYEVEAGKIAAEKAADPDVKAFGQKMVDDHGKANDKIKQIAGDKGVKLPTALGTLDKHNLEKLQKTNGADFDRLYISEMVKDHKKDVSDFQHVSKAAKDNDVKTFASDTLPTLQDHLKMAEAAATKIGASTKHATTSKKSK
jgi:putative membrane protein